MFYRINSNQNHVKIEVEESFTLIDFILLIVCFLFGIFFALFLWIFAGAVLLKIFTNREYVFDTDRYNIECFLKIFSYFRFKIRTIPFGEVKKIIFTDRNPELVLTEKGTSGKHWTTLEIETDSGIIRLARVEEDELEDAFSLFEEMERELDLYFNFSNEFGFGIS